MNFIEKLKKNPEKFEKTMILLKFGMLFLNLFILFGFIMFIVFLIIKS